VRTMLYGPQPNFLTPSPRYTLSDALAVSVWLNVFIRQSKYIGMANIAQSINVISPLMTTKTGLVKQTTWWPLLLFSKYMHGHTIGVHVQCPEYEGPTAPEWIRGTVETPWLDVSASLTDDGWMTLAVVNSHETKSFATKIDGIPEGEVNIFLVTGHNVNVINTEHKQEVDIKESTWDGKTLYEFQKHSLTMLRWKVLE
jgi:alpha-N-arabinofuranosidase